MLGRSLPPLLLVLLVLASCGFSQLTPAGAAVIVAAQTKADCRPLGPVKADEGRNFHSAAQNVAEVRVELQNQAAALGGDYLVIAPPGAPDPSCPNCVAMTAQVFRCAK